MDVALIVRRPWVDLILNGKKTWEMRSRMTNIRGVVGLIEAGSGLVFGEVEIVNSIPLSLRYLKDKIHKHQVDDFSLLEKWNVAWVLKNEKRYINPVPYNHPKGAVVWVKLTEQVKENIERVRNG